jgi:hypothetical protein
MEEMPSSFAAFKDVPGLKQEGEGAGKDESKEVQCPVSR